MKQVLEFSFFLAGATALHLSAGFIAPQGQTSAAGEGGTAALSLVAASASVQDMVRMWDAPVTVAQQTAQPIAQQPDTPRIALPSADTGVARSPSAPALPTSEAPQLPQIDRSVAPPPPQPVIAQTRLVERPATLSKAAPVSPKPAQSAKPKPVQAKPSKKTTAAAPAQKAAGTGSSKTAGRQARGTAQKAQPGNAKNLVAAWGGQIRNSIERRKRYPSGTRAKGTVTLAISVHSRGAVVGVSVRGSSGVTQIDRAAVAAVQSARIAAAPKGVPSGVHSFTLPMRFAP
jgi:periplasmic protein TonB